MRPDTPILSITLHIPLLPDTSVEDVLGAIEVQVGEALESIREQQASEIPDEAPAEEPGGASSFEALEPFTESTQSDLLAALGYATDK